MKKKLIVTSLLAATVFASAANAATFNITGSIASTPCEVTATNPNIKMPWISKTKLGKAGEFSTAPAQELRITLKNCPAVNQTAVVQFTGTADTEDNKALKLTGVDGVALAVFEDDGTTQINIGGKAKGKAVISTSDNVLKYKVKYVTTSKAFKEGNATATLNFDVAYN
ncbi:fimbrial protein [Yersinia massiliensis]|uniref:fimbrial protein n=1 Tax=Yersinia massiliensis TaxID=419257 RepID=UPI0011A71057|nr:fimbrial protein [Yersinia massiliensis]MCB5308646.1 type 1 fimbrial protein [Yersinia massiliensis]